MENAGRFREKWSQGQFVVGTGITFTDPTVSEALANLLDFVFVDMEHNALSLETVQGHIMATRASGAAAVVRVPWNDPVLIKPVLDIGADAIMVPLIRTADDARRAVEACLYPPEGIRGFGPRRPIRYGQVKDPDYCRNANRAVIPMVQIEHIDAVKNLDEIVAVPGLGAAMIGPNDLSGSMGLMGQTSHPDVVAVMETVVHKCREAGLPVGAGLADNPDLLIEWIDKGLNWVVMGVDWLLLMNSAESVLRRIREHPQGERV